MPEERYDEFEERGEQQPVRSRGQAVRQVLLERGASALDRLIEYQERPEEPDNENLDDFVNIDEDGQAQVFGDETEDWVTDVGSDMGLSESDADFLFGTDFEEDEDTPEEIAKQTAEDAETDSFISNPDWGDEEPKPKPKQAPVSVYKLQPPTRRPQAPPARGVPPSIGSVRRDW